MSVTYDSDGYPEPVTVHDTDDQPWTLRWLPEALGWFLDRPDGTSELWSRYPVYVQHGRWDLLPAGLGPVLEAQLCSEPERPVSGEPLPLDHGARLRVEVASRAPGYCVGDALYEYDRSN